MGLRNPKFDKAQWAKALAGLGLSDPGACRQKNSPQFDLKKDLPPRKGEVHCVEPMPMTFQALENATQGLNLGDEGFVVTKAAISSRDGSVPFPKANTRGGKAGSETSGLDSCKGDKCEKVPMFSLQTYVDKFVKSKGPINILSIDVEGFDFDVLFGAGTVLDRTQYLEFEFHAIGAWVKYHLTDIVGLLDGKGFTCYWAGNDRLWRITGCLHEIYATAHGWSNVACVHRSYTKLAKNMESKFLDGIQVAQPQ